MKELHACLFPRLVGIKMRFFSSASVLHACISSLSRRE